MEKKLIKRTSQIQVIEKSYRKDRNFVLMFIKKIFKSTEPRTMLLTAELV